MAAVLSDSHRRLPLTRSCAARSCAAFALSTLLCIVGAGCGAPAAAPTPGAETEPRELDAPAAPVVVARFAPSENAVPFPNNIYKGALVITLPGELAANDAERAIFADLDGASGFHRESAIFIPTVGGALQADSLNGHVHLFNAASQAEVNFTVEQTPGGIKLVPDQWLTAGATFAYAITSGPVGLSGGPLVADPLYYAYVAQALGAADQDPNAADPRVQAEVDAALTALSMRGIAIETVVVAGQFTTLSAPIVPFSPSGWPAPFPHPALTRADNTVALSDTVFGGLNATRFSKYDGFGTEGPVLFQFEHEIDFDAELIDAMALVSGGPEGRALTASEAWVHFDTEASLAPDAPFWPGTTVSAFLFRGANDSDTLYDRSLLLSAALSPAALTDENDESTVRILSRAGAVAVEALRSDFAPALDDLALTGRTADELLALTHYRTQSATGVIAPMRQMLVDQVVTPVVRNTLNATPAERGLWIVMPSVETVLSGTIETLDFVQPQGQGLREDGPVLSDIEFLLTLPDSAEPGTPVPVVLFGHGLMTSRELVYLAANFLADAGYATFAIDLPMHGERAPCLADSQCTEGACMPNGKCTDDLGQTYPVQKWAGPFPNGPQVPVSTGEAFVNLHDPFASRDHFLQGLVDLSQAVRALQQVDFAMYADGLSVDGTDIVYMGMSLGGIFGASFSAIEPAINDFALNVPGAGLADLMQQSDSLRDQVQEFGLSTGLLPGTSGYDMYLWESKWALDAVDPQTLVRPRPDKRYLLQMASDDIVVPNVATERLSAALGEPYVEYSPLISNHAFLFDPTSLEGASARTAIVQFFNARP